MKRYRVWLALAGLALFLAGAWIYFNHRSGKQNSFPATRVVKVKSGNVTETVGATGDVVPLNRVEIKPPVSGRLDKIIVAEGDHVKSGQTLALMSSMERAAILDSATAMSPEERKQWEESYKPAPILSPPTLSSVRRSST